VFRVALLVCSFAVRRWLDPGNTRWQESSTLVLLLARRKHITQHIFVIGRYPVGLSFLLWLLQAFLEKVARSPTHDREAQSCFTIVSTAIQCNTVTSARWIISHIPFLSPCSTRDLFFSSDLRVSMISYLYYHSIP
jgi:hypothetical protein